MRTVQLLLVLITALGLFVLPMSSAYGAACTPSLTATTVPIVQENGEILALRVDLQATGPEPGNTLKRVSFASTSNASVERPSGAVQPVPATVDLGTPTWSFVARKAVRGQPFLVTFSVADRCGEVRKFAGAGVGGAAAQASSTGAFTTSASVEPASPTVGSTATIMASVTSSTAANVVVDVEVYGPDGAKVHQQYFENQALATGAGKTYSVSWAVPASAPAGTYKVVVAIFGTGWQQLAPWDTWTGRALAFTVRSSGSAGPPPTATSTPTSSPTLVPPTPTPTNTSVPTAPTNGFATEATVPPSTPAGQNLTVSLAITTAAALSGIVDVEVYGPTGDKVYQQWFEGQAFAAGQPEHFSVTWPVPPTAAPGQYKVLVAVFGPSWATLVPWSTWTARMTPFAIGAPTTSYPSGPPIDYVAPQAASRPPAADALQARVRSELKVFTDWLATNHVAGFVGEVGWPNNHAGEADEWNALAQAWYADADAAGLWVAAWDTGQDRCGYYLAIYKTAECGRPPVAIPDTQAVVLEAHPSSARYQRGINIVGPGQAAPYRSEPTSTFSNRTPGTYGTDWIYDEQSTFDYLAGRGLKLVRLGFRWERLQPDLGQPFDAAELARLKQAVGRARAAGLEVTLNPQNFAAYYLWDGSKGVRRNIAVDQELPQIYFNDLWTRLSQEFRNDPGVLGYGLVNEPLYTGSSQQWELISQSAVNAIRATGDTKLILVPGYNASSAARWSDEHARPWISDPANHIRYEAHVYFDRDRSGEYAHPYADEVVDAAGRGYRAGWTP